MKGIKFDDFHSWNDFHLILSKKTIGSPEPKTEYIDVPGADGTLDLTEYFGETKYENRTLKFEFSTIVPMSDFLDLFSEIQNALHGKKMKIVLDEDPEYYYIGRVSVNEWNADKNIGKVTIECDCEPYKYRKYKTVLTTTINGEATVLYTNLRKHVVPTFTTTAEINVAFEGNTYSISSGTFTVPEIVFKAGKNLIDYTGTATVTVEYQERGL